MAAFVGAVAIILFVFALITPSGTGGGSSPKDSLGSALTAPTMPTPTTMPVPTTGPYVKFGPTGLALQNIGSDGFDTATYDFTSSDDGPGTQQLRVLKPTHPAPGVAHNFLYVLPVQAGPDVPTWGNALNTLWALNAQNTYNLTIVEPTFAVDPWYANNPINPNVQYETFITTQLVPWVKATLSTTGHEQNWLIGFSKSGYGVQDLILKYPDLFAVAASWDFPARMDALGQYADTPANYGTEANFQAHYRLTPAFLEAHATPFEDRNRIWIGSYAAFAGDVFAYDALLSAAGIMHTTEPATPMTHAWDSGWLPLALAALYKDSLAQP